MGLLMFVFVGFFIIKATLTLHDVRERLVAWSDFIHIQNATLPPPLPKNNDTSYRQIALLDSDSLYKQYNISTTPIVIEKYKLGEVAYLFSSGCSHKLPLMLLLLQCFSLWQKEVPQ